MSKGETDNRCYDSLNAVTPENKEEYIRKINSVKSEKLRIFKMVVEALSKNNIKFWLDMGTLLGAYRNGEMIPHDLDMDLAVFGEEDLSKAGRLLEDLTPTGYTLNYGHFSGAPSKKIELTKTGFGATDPEGVWIDIVMYIYNKEQDYVWTPYGSYGLENNRYKLDWIFPLGSIMFEGMEMPCPRDSKAYLTELYGYLGKDCFYNTETQKYEKR